MGEQLKRINTLVQLGWMLDDPVQLEGDFGDYLSVLSRDHLDRMILFGGQNVIETTIRSGQLDTGDRLLPLWLDAAVSQNDPNSLLDFASNSLCGRRFWTANKLMESALSSSSISMNQRFLAVAYRCLALSGIYEMVNDVDHNLRTELDIAQARWVLAHHSPESLLAQCKASLNTAHQAWARIAQPTRGHRMVKAQLDSMEERVIGSRSAGNEEEAQRTR